MALKSSFRSASIALLLLSLSTIALAHEHHEVETGPYEQNFTNEEPIDFILKWHIGIQVACWGFLFPAGMILGLNKSRYHVPFQLVTSSLSIFAGNFLGHHHRGRSFHYTAHAAFASYLWWYVVLQAGLGGFLKLHLMEGGKIRRVMKLVHRVVGISFPIVGWVQMVFGAIAALGFCFGDHLGQCLAHEIMGSSFILYGFIMLLMLKFGAEFLRKREWSQEMIDSTVICLWGIVNTFTEHNFFGQDSRWSHKDMQHVSLGVLWVCGGALGMWISRAGKRSVVPALIIAMTGLAMANHGQHLEFSTTVHKAFGYSLVAAGLTRLIEICFVLNDEPTPSLSSPVPNSTSTSTSNSTIVAPKAFQHLPPYLLVLSGFSFMSATEEQMSWISQSGMDSTTYIIGLFSGGFVIYLVGNVMLDFFQWSSRPTGEESSQADVETGRGGRGSWFENVWKRFPGRGRRLDDDRSRNGFAGNRTYENVPLTSGEMRDSVDVRNGGFEGEEEGSSQESFELSTRRRQGETVFDLGDDEEVDNGDDGYWKEANSTPDYNKQQLVTQSQLNQAVKTGVAAPPPPGVQAPPPPPPPRQPAIPQPDPQDDKQLWGEKVYQTHVEITDLADLRRKYDSSTKTRCSVTMSASMVASSAARSPSVEPLVKFQSQKGVVGVNLVSRPNWKDRIVMQGHSIDDYPDFTLTGLQGVAQLAASVDSEQALFQLLLSPRIRQHLNIPAAGLPPIKRFSDLDDRTIVGKSLRTLILEEIAKLPDTLLPSDVPFIQQAFSIFYDVFGCSSTSRSADNKKRIGFALAEAFRLMARLLSPHLGNRSTYKLYGPTVGFNVQNNTKGLVQLLTNLGKVKTVWNIPTDEESKLAEAASQPPHSMSYFISNSSLPNPSWENSLHVLFQDIITKDPSKDRMEVKDLFSAVQKLIPAIEAALTAYPRPFTQEQIVARLSSIHPYFARPTYEYKVRWHATRQAYAITARDNQTRLFTDLTKLEAQKLRSYMCYLHSILKGDKRSILWFSHIHRLVLDDVDDETIDTLTQQFLPLADDATEFWCSSCARVQDIGELCESPIDQTRWCTVCFAILSARYGHLDRASFRRKVLASRDPKTPYRRLFLRVDDDARQTRRKVLGGPLDARIDNLENVNSLWKPTPSGEILCAFFGDSLGDTILARKPFLSGDAVVQGLSLKLPGSTSLVRSLHDEIRNVVPTSAQRNVMMVSNSKQMLKFFAILITLQRLRKVGLESELEPFVDSVSSEVCQTLDLIGQIETTYNYPLNFRITKHDPPNQQTDYDRVHLIDCAAKEVIEGPIGTGSTEWLRDFPDYKDITSTIAENDFREHVKPFKDRSHAYLSTPATSAPVLESLRTMAKEIEERWEFSFNWYHDEEFGDLPSFVSKEDIELYESRGQKLTPTTLVNECYLRLARYVNECNKNYFDPAVSFLTLYLTFLVSLAEGSGNHIDPLLGEGVIFLTPNHPRSGGIGHIAQGESMRVPFRRRDPSSMDDYDKKICNVHVRTWRGRWYIIAGQRASNKSCVDADLLGMYQFVSNLFSSGKVKLKDDSKLNELSLALQNMLASPNSPPSSHLSEFFEHLSSDAVSPPIPAVPPTSSSSSLGLT
ncbi:hypothetical protein JCM5350_005421 [Sporobolomyces pararoseus]